MSSISKILKNLNFFALFYCTLIYNISGSKSRGGYHDMEQSENPRKRTKSAHSVPISCVVCHRVFFDNVNLCLHFEESHLIEEIPALSHHSRSVASLQRESRFLQSSCSYVSRTSEAPHVESPSMNDLARSSSLLVRSVESPNVLPKYVNLVQLPVANSMPPLGARNCAPGLASLLTLPLNMANGGQGPSLVNRSHRNIQFVRPSEELIVISDDEEDEIDLTLRL